MKWLNLLFIGVIAVSFNACQQHDKADLKLIGTPAEHAEGAAPEKEKKETTPAASESKPATKFF